MEDDKKVPKFHLDINGLSLHPSMVWILRATPDSAFLAASRERASGTLFARLSLQDFSRRYSHSRAAPFTFLALGLSVNIKTEGRS